MKPLPQDPQLAKLITMMSRRRVLQAGALAGVGAVVAACGGGIGGGGNASSSAAAVEDLSDTEKFFNWSTWIDYIDVDDAGNRPSLEKFKADTGITCNYNEDYNDNDEFFAKVRAQLESGQSIDRDLVTPTDWMAALWIRNGYAQQLDLANIPNHKNIDPLWMGVAFDPERTVSMPWQSGFAGLGWNRKLLKSETGMSELRSLDDLWNPKLKGRITVLSEMRDTMGVTLMAMGKRADKFTDADFDAAIELLQQKVDEGFIRQVSGNDYKTAMASGEVIAAIAWSGDMLNDTKTYGFNLPDSGGTLWTDNLIIPVGAKHKKNAETWLNYYYQPEIAAMIAAYVNYITPVAGAKEAMASIDPAMVDNQAIFPSEETKKKVQVFMQLTDAQQASYSEKFAALAGA